MAPRRRPVTEASRGRAKCAPIGSGGFRLRTGAGTPDGDPFSQPIGDLYAPSLVAARPSCHCTALRVIRRERGQRVHLTRSRAALCVRRKQRRDVRERLCRAVQPRHLVRRPDGLDAAVRVRCEHVVVGHRVVGHGRAGPRVPRRARLRRRERRCASCRGRDRDVEPRCDGRQGRRREQRHAALVRCDSWLVRGRCRRRRLRRVRHRRRLRRRRRGSRSRCDIGDRPTRGRLHRHRLEHGRLLDDRTCSRQLVCGRVAVLRWRWLVLCIRRAHRCVCRSNP